MPIYVWFLIVTISGMNPDGSPAFSGQHLNTFPTLTECETVAYNMQDYTIQFEKDNKVEAELQCVKHAVTTSI